MKIGYSHFLNSLVNAKAYSQVAKIHKNPALYTIVFIVFFLHTSSCLSWTSYITAFPNIFVEKANKFRCSVLTLHINLNPNPQISCLLIPNQNKALGTNSKSKHNAYHSPLPNYPPSCKPSLWVNSKRTRMNRIWYLV